MRDPQQAVQIDSIGLSHSRGYSAGRRRKVLIVVWRLSEGGGIQTVVRSILRYADKSAFEFHVCTLRPLEWDGHNAEGVNGEAMHSLGLSGNLTPRGAARLSLELAALVRRLRPDVLHLHGGTAALGLPAALLHRRCRKVLEIHDAPDSGRFSQRTLSLERWLGKYLGFGPIVHSANVRQCVARSWGIAEHSIRLVPLGIETGPALPSKSDRERVRQSLAVSDREAMVLYVGRLVPEKRPDLFLRAAREVLKSEPAVRFVLAGGGSGSEALKDLAEDLGISGRVTFLGFVDDLRSVYAAADTFVSTSRYEGWGLAIAEAMASGLPVVATRVGGVEDVVGGCGILVDSDDPVVIGRAVADLIRDTERRARLGADAMRRAREHLDVRQSVAAFEEVYGRPGVPPADGRDDKSSDAKSPIA